MSDVPDKPRNLEVVEMRKDSASLTWKEPESDGGTPVTGYHVERMSKGSARWLKITKAPVPELKYEVKDLVEGTEYQFRVFAENKVGPGKPCEPTKPMVAKDPWGMAFIILNSS